MASVQVDFTDIEQGATYAFGLCWGVLAVDASGVPILDATGMQTTEPYDLTGCTARMQFRLKQSTPILLTAVSPTDITLVARTVVTVTSIVVLTNVATFTATAHGLAVGSVFGLHGSTHDGFWKVASVIDANTFTVAMTTANATETGTFQAVLCGVNNIAVVLADTLTDLLTYTSAVHDLKIYWTSAGTEDFVIHGTDTVRLRITDDTAIV